VTAINLEDELALSESKWRGRLITAALLLGASAIAGVVVYYVAFRGDSSSVTRSTEEIPVARATISQTLSISGVADAQLNSNLTFQASGKIAAVNVRVGDSVAQGDVLASIESDDLVNAVAQAQANQSAAQLRLDDLLSGSTAADLAAAEQALVSAQANLTKAKNDYNTLVGGGSAADVAAAQQAVSAADAQLASAKSARAKLADTPTAADRAAAEAAVAAAQSALTAAQNTAATEQNNVITSAASLISAEYGYCAADATPAFCPPPATPISSADATLMTDAVNSANDPLAAAVLGANTAYLNAQNRASSAQAAVTSAQDSLASAQARLSAVNAGPTSAEVAAATAAVTSAQAGVDAVKQKLLLLLQGGTDAQRSTAAAAVLSAQAAVDGAAAKLVDARQKPTQNAIDQARQAVSTAALAVQAAQIRRRNAQIVAPFDGVIAAVNAHVGEFAGAPGGTTAAPIVLLTPNLLRLKMNVQETDYASIKLDQGGVVLFDALAGKPFPFRVTSIGSAPTTTNGVVTYQVEAALTIPPGSPSPAAGMNGRGLITTDSKPNVLVVPARAIKRRGTEQIVSVKRANGNVEEQVITTGASDANNVEVLTGLVEGDTVEVVTLTTAKAGATPKPQATIPSGLR